MSNEYIKPEHWPGREVKTCVPELPTFVIVLKYYKVRGRRSWFYVYKCTASRPAHKEFYYLVENTLTAVE